MIYLDTSYRNHSAEQLLSYIDKEQSLRNSAGRELSGPEIEQFVAETREHQFEREIQISPSDDVDLSRDELERETRRFVRDYTRDRPSVRAVYAVHEDTDHPHVHVALAGERRDLFMDRDDVEHAKDRADELLSIGNVNTNSSRNGTAVGPSAVRFSPFLSG